METTEIKKSEKMDNQFYGEIPTVDNSKFDTALEMIRQRLLMYKYDLDAAKLNSYDASKDSTMHWTIKIEKENFVQFIEGKINALEKLKKDLENMITPALVL